MAMELNPAPTATLPLPTRPAHGPASDSASRPPLAPQVIRPHAVPGHSDAVSRIDVYRRRRQIARMRSAGENVAWVAGAMAVVFLALAGVFGLR